MARPPWKYVIDPADSKHELANWDRWERQLGAYPPDIYVASRKAGQRYLDWRIWGSLTAFAALPLVYLGLAIPTRLMAARYVLLALYVAVLFTTVAKTAVWMVRYMRLEKKGRAAFNAYMRERKVALDAAKAQPAAGEAGTPS